MSKTLSNSPKPENILNALQQASTPLSINELAGKTNVVARNLLNPLIKQMIQEGKIVQTEDSPPKFKLAGDAGFSLDSQPASPRAKTKPTDNVVHMSSKTPRAAKAETTAPAKVADAAPKATSQPASQQANIRDVVIQQLQKAPTEIAVLEEQHPGFADILANLHAEGLIVQDKIMNSETIYLSPKGEELYAQMVADGVLSKDAITQAPAAVSTTSKQQAKEAAQKAPAETEGKRPIGRPKGSTNKKNAGEQPTGKDKSATPKSPTASPAAPAPAPVKPKDAAAQPDEAASQAPAAEERGALSGLSGQLMELLEVAARNAVDAQTKAQAQRDERNAKIAQDMASLSELMFEMGNRLKSLSETLNAE
ncbi:hypothetical protein [Pseudomonas amygdali]|uniref:Uncharacterized protein n=2 Tax=Pseudomonas amygdali pv. lachrymans TaxID=53707 RepID=A0ABR5KSQ8_PSEAV|nr:hypothetical protein [Pseudomonas amygdali]AXH59455.1 hypothetical protein PLA107_029965 [Pseudomonas amygdali pv. lachrymans str. M301315]KPC16883.1 Uncharacterized protein AC499_0085 [Pseudomonas amygdali pv. lachrymans]KPC17842.1 Uncharacterized protein AC499_1044 [Pseudomonas amygdali pv. lachrymans]RMT06358.1 hypothetical protein ALP54_03384 [Pseudomonas amygdali pv. lachrymans]